jgi:hypothetical protein
MTSDILEDFSTPSLLQAMEKNVHEAWIRLAHGLGAVVCDESDWHLAINTHGPQSLSSPGVSRVLHVSGILLARVVGEKHDQSVSTDVKRFARLPYFIDCDVEYMYARRGLIVLDAQ